MMNEKIIIIKKKTVECEEKLIPKSRYTMKCAHYGWKTKLLGKNYLIVIRFYP